MLESLPGGFNPKNRSQVGGISADSAAVTTYPGPNAAYFSPFHSPTTVDHRVVRVNGVITFVVAVMTAVFAQRDVTEWVVSYGRGGSEASGQGVCQIIVMSSLEEKITKNAKFSS